MANPLPLVALAGDDLAFTATFEITGPQPEDPDYPASNLRNGDPASVAKGDGTSAIIEVTTSSQSLAGVALINTNATTATIEGIDIPIPSLDYDGQRVHAWLDRRDDPLGPSTSWTLELSAFTGQLSIGHIALLVNLHELNLKYGLTVGRKRPGDVEFTTRLGSQLRYGAQVRTRWARGMVDLEEDEALMRNLESSAKGIILPFIFIPDEAVNDAWLVKYVANDWALTYPNYGVREVPLAFEEVACGPPNG